MSEDIDLRDSVVSALEKATKAETNAGEALRISKANSDQLMGLAVSQQRTEKLLNEHKSKSEERHTEVMGAIEGAVRNDKNLAEGQKALENKLSNADVGKIAGGVTALLVAVAGALTLIATQLAPVLPSVVNAKYGQPTVIVQAAPSAAPAVSR